MSFLKTESTRARICGVHHLPPSIFLRFRYAKSCRRHALKKLNVRPVLPNTGTEHPSVVQVRRASRASELAIVRNAGREVWKTKVRTRASGAGGGAADIHAATRIEARTAMRISFAWLCVPKCAPAGTVMCSTPEGTSTKGPFQRRQPPPRRLCCRSQVHCDQWLVVLYSP